MQYNGRGKNLLLPIIVDLQTVRQFWNAKQHVIVSPSTPSVIVTAASVMNGVELIELGFQDVRNELPIIQ